MTRADGRLIAVALLAAALSDVYDGRIARRFGVATAGLRRFDSIADSVFYLCVGFALWVTYPDIVRAHAILLIAFALMQIIGHLTDVLKFGKDTTYHTWTGRVFSALLLVATIFIFWNGRAGPWLTIALVAGMLAHVDAFVISMILPEWRHDVHTIRNALAIRRTIKQSQTGRTAGP
jgi:phosphatidylglycerophosphate synthase